MQVTSALVVERLAASCRCTECGGRFAAEDIHVLAHRGAAIWEIAAVCQRCSTMSLIRAVVRRSRGHSGQARPIGELTPAEKTRFGDLPPIGPGDVTRAGEFLAAFDGDFERLFHSPSEGL